MTPIARPVFAALVIATFGAFFAAQRLKHSPSLIQSFRATPLFSPNRDGRLDRERISFRLKHADDVTVEIVDVRGDQVRELLTDRHLEAYRQLPTLRWDGRTDSGRRAPDGLYRVRIILRRQGRSVVVPRSFRLDTTPPRPTVYAIGPVRSRVRQPELLPIPGGGSAVAHFRPAGRRAQALLFRTAPGRPRLVLVRSLPDGATSWRWNGRNNGRAVSPATYLVVVRTRDLAGNIGTSVPLGRDGLPLTRYGEPLPGRGGITVRYVGVQPPVEPVRAGRLGEFFVDARRERYTWTLRRVGGPRRPIRRGTGTRARLRIHAPRGSSGVYLLTAGTGGHRTRVPFAVQGRRSRGGTTASPRGVLLVLPVITWQGRSPVDDDGDGAVDTLTTGRDVRLARIFPGSGLPPGFARHEAAVAGFLDRHRRRYDVTTDAALAAGRGPRLARYRGVLLAGDARWLPLSVGLQLRRFVRSRGVLVSLGTGSLRRLVRLAPTARLVQPTAPAPADLFGARLRPIVRRRVNLTILKDRIGLFVGGGGLFSGVSSYEETAAVGPSATLVASAVTPRGHPVIVAARFGSGLVVRTGYSSFAAHLRSDRAVAGLMERMWTLLSR